jgi:hypothetical protein
MHLLRKRRYEDLGRSHWLREAPYTGQLRQSDEHSPGKERGLFCDAFPRKMNRRCVEGRQGSAIVRACSLKRKTPATRTGVSQVDVVAGTGFEPVTFRLCDSLGCITILYDTVLISRR